MWCCAPERAQRRIYMAVAGDPFEMRINGRAALMNARLERARQPEDVLGEVGEDEVGGDRRDEVQPCLAELALDVVLGGEAEAPVRLQADVRRLPGGLGGEVLRHVGFG